MLRTICVERKSPRRGEICLEKGNDTKMAPRRGATILSLLSLLFLISCLSNNDPLIGRWAPEKVNVDFDENIATPEMVRMFGEIDKANIIEISKDSVLVFISDGDTLTSRYSLQGQTLYMNGKPFAQYLGGRLVTEEITPLGKVIVQYSKKNQ